MCYGVHEKWLHFDDWWPGNWWRHTGFMPQRTSVITIYWQYLAWLEQTVPVSALLLQFNLECRQSLLYAIRLFLLSCQPLPNVVHFGFEVVRLRLQRQTSHLHLLLALHLLVNYLCNTQHYLCPTKETTAFNVAHCLV